MQQLLSKFVVSALAGLALVSFAQANEVYRWQDADGRLTFSDRPLSEDAKSYTPHSGPVGEDIADPVVLRRQQQCDTAERNLVDVIAQINYEISEDKEAGTYNEGAAEGKNTARIAEARHSIKVWCRKPKGQQAG
jgi:hypothetical protein